jgi:hypothetical protein
MYPPGEDGWRNRVDNVGASHGEPRGTDMNQGMIKERNLDLKLISRPVPKVHMVQNRSCI